MESLRREIEARISQLSHDDQREARSTVRIALADLSTWNQLVYLKRWIEGFDYNTTPNGGAE